MIRRSHRKPDILLLLALVLGVGVLVTTYSQELFATHINYSYTPEEDSAT